MHSCVFAQNLNRYSANRDTTYMMIAFLPLHPNRSGRYSDSNSCHIHAMHIKSESLIMTMQCEDMAYMRALATSINKHCSIHYDI